MMTAINGLVVEAGSSLVGLIVVKVTIVAALGLAATWLARRSRAAVRHALLAVTFGAMLLLPIASVVAPPVHVTVPVAEVSRATWPLVVNNTARIPPVTPPTAGGVAPAAPQQSPTFSLSVLLLAGWIVGVAVFLLPVMTGLWQIRSLRRSGLPWLEGQSIAETLAPGAGIHGRVEVLLHEGLAGPITCGVLHPAIVLPQDAEDWKEEDLNRAIVHELEHVRRRDSATRCLARAACALYWFHPLAWIAWRKLVLEAERSCDDAVLRRSEATAYADQLVGLAKRLPTVQRSPLVAMASRSDLAARVGAVLDGELRRGRVGTSSLALACAAAVLLVVVMSPLTLVAAPQAGPVLKFEVASVKPREYPANSHLNPRLSITPRVSGNRVAAGGSLLGIIMAAYNVRDFQIVGVPDLSDKFGRTQLYDVVAKTEGDGTPAIDHVRGMLQTLLADRFQLKVHRETRVLPVFNLVAGKGGSKLKVSGGPLPAEVPKDGFAAGVMLKYTNRAMADIVSIISVPISRPVLDKTGLDGRYDFSLEMVGGGPSAEDRMFEVVQEQLGLRFVAAREPVDVIVIDHAEKPSGN